MPALDTETQRDNLPSAPHNVPAQLTTLVGREREVEAICELLRGEDVRLLTLTGAPGIGKTRLGIEAAAVLRGSPGTDALRAGTPYFSGGIYFVNLAVVTNVIPYIMALSALPVMMWAASVPKTTYQRNVVVALVAMLYSVYALYASGKDAVLGGMLVTAIVFVIWGFLAPRFAPQPVAAAKRAKAA